MSRKLLTHILNEELAMHKKKVVQHIESGYIKVPAVAGYLHGKSVVLARMALQCDDVAVLDTAEELISKTLPYWSEALEKN